MNTPWICFIVVCCSLLLSGAIMTNRISCKMQHHNILHFPLMWGLPTILLVNGCSIKDQQNVFCVICLWDSATREVYWSKTILHELEQQIQETSTAVPLDFFRKSIIRVCAFHGAEVCATCWSLWWHLTLNGSVWAITWCKNSSNMAFHLGNGATWYYIFTFQLQCTLK